jgi:hypothetical protein
MQKKQWFIVILFVVALIGVTATSYFSDLQPTNVVGPALAKLRNADAVVAAVTIATFAPQSMIKDVKSMPGAIVPVSIVGKIEMNVPRGKAASGSGTLSVAGQGRDGKDLTLDIVSGEDGKSFVRATNIPREAAAIGPALAAADGKWYATDSQTLASYFFRDAAGVAGGVVGDRPAATWNTVLDDLSAGDMFGSPVFMDDKFSSGVTVDHYQLPLQRDATVGFVQDLQSAALGAALTDDELNAIAAAVDSHDTTLEVWVDAKHEEITQMQIDVEPRDGKGSPFGAVAEFISWNGPIAVIPPTDSTPLPDLIENFANRFN